MTHEDAFKDITKHVMHIARKDALNSAAKYVNYAAKECNIELTNDETDLIILYITKLVQDKIYELENKKLIKKIEVKHSPGQKI